MQLVAQYRHRIDVDRWPPITADGNASIPGAWSSTARRTGDCLSRTCGRRGD